MKSFLLDKRRRERGGIMLIVAVLLAGGVLMGMLALSVDVGQIMYERRQLQNGADATSLALADACARDTADCTPGSGTIAALLGQNAADGAAQYDSSRPGAGVCGRGVTQLDACAAPNADMADLAECTPLPPWLADNSAIPYVETYTATETASGGDKLLLPFSRVLAGGSAGDKGTTACARAAWGPPTSHTATVPVTFSECEWQRFMDATGDEYPAGPSGAAPGYGGVDQPGWPDAGVERVVKLKDSDSTAACTFSNGKDGSGGFGDLKGTGCKATAITNKWILGDPGNNIQNDCKTVLPPLRGTVIDVPVFDCYYRSNNVYTGPVSGATCNGGSGGQHNYHIAGWAKFYLSGFSFPGGTVRQPSLLTGNYPCANNETCLSGWFLTGELQAEAISEPGGDNDYGTYAVLSAG
ncbi:TadE/TadG family type IV pilus assembly protein [Kribbia dieselivorans]|uniref:TadE/TadG family type IV pilus assembly protein n=1 Tax=Kribbia dieselivorans TaxID=331526 RepID=UPI0008386BC7|nr:TadE/TadG family type IV pilus assembly protein [Kribbia dieselivorans]